MIRKICLLFSATVLLSFLNGCGALYQATYGDATTVIAYQEEEITKDYTKISSLSVPAGYGLDVDGEEVLKLNGPPNPALKVSKGTDSDIMLTVDLKPGVHTLAISINKSSLEWDQDTSSHYTRRTWTDKPIVIVHNFMAGQAYLVEITMMGSLNITPLPDDIRAIIIENRNKAQF